MELWTPIATQIIGYGAQWLFALQRFPSSLTYALITALAVVLYLMGCDCKPTWDSKFFISAAGWILLLLQSIRGAAAMAKNAKAAPGSNTL